MISLEKEDISENTLLSRFMSYTCNNSGEGWKKSSILVTVWNEMASVLFKLLKCYEQSLIIKQSSTSMFIFVDSIAELLLKKIDSSLLV